MNMEKNDEKEKNSQEQEQEWCERLKMLIDKLDKALVK